MKKNLLCISGMEQLNALVFEWEKIAKRKVNFPIHFYLPNYFLVINPEISVEKVVDELTTNLEKNQLMEFAGPVHSYLYMLTYSSDNDSEFTSFKNFYEIFIKELSKFGETFKGILAIDITEWIENRSCDSKKFMAFLDFMSSIDKDTMALFISRCTNEDKNRDAYQVVATKSRVRRINIGEVSTKDGLDYLCALFKEGNFKLDDDTISSLKTIVDFIFHVDGNEGLKSLRQLYDQIVYDLLCGDAEDISIITVDNIKKYLPDGEWAKSYKFSRKKYLGLIGGEEK